MSPIQGDGECDPIAGGRFHHHQVRLGDDTSGGEPLLKGGEASFGLLERSGLWSAVKAWR